MSEADLLARIVAHCEERKISTATFGKDVVNDGKLVSRLQAGKSITLKTYSAIQQALDSPKEAGVTP